MNQITDNLMYLKLRILYFILSLWGSIKEFYQESEKIKCVLLKYSLNYYIKKEVLWARIDET